MSVLNVISGKNICFSMGDYTLTSDNCYVESMTTSIQNNMQAMGSIGSREVDMVPGVQICRIELTLITTDMNFSFTTEESNKIRYKKVEDCSPEELLFAARTKLENKKN